MEEVVFINVQSNIPRESEASTGKSDDGRLKQQGAYDNLEDSSNNKEVRSNKKRTNDNDDDNDLEQDRKKRRVVKQDSVNNGKVVESLVTNLDGLPKNRNTAATKQFRKTDDVQCDDNNTNEYWQNNNNCDKSFMKDVGRNKGNLEQQPKNSNIDEGYAIEKDKTSRKRYK